MQYQAKQVSRFIIIIYIWPRCHQHSDLTNMKPEMVFHFIIIIVVVVGLKVQINVAPNEPKTLYYLFSPTIHNTKTNIQNT